LIRASISAEGEFPSFALVAALLAFFMVLSLSSSLCGSPWLDHR
jgi:hypothetical protein